MREYEQTKSGPALYNPVFKLTEKRTDLGIVTIREPYYDSSGIELDLKPSIEPNIDAIKPNKMAFKYHLPTDQKPMHVPDSITNPGNWVYYDVDLDVVREQLKLGNVYMAGNGEN